MHRNKALGAWGEEQAAEFLKKKGYRIISANFVTKFGEIDLIAINSRYIVFAEVKLRKNASFAQAREFVDFRKQNRIRTSASLFLSWHQYDLQPRFDVIEIYAPEGMESRTPQIIHLEDAFQ